MTNEGTAPADGHPLGHRPPDAAGPTTPARSPWQRSPTFIDGEGNTDFYALHKFTVPPGADYLNGDITWNAPTRPAAAVFETLFDPPGQVAAYSLLGTDQSGFGHVEVRQPTPVRGRR